MNHIASALSPVLLLIVLGYALSRLRLLSREAWSGIERLTYFVLFPALLIRTLGNQDPASAPWSTLLLAVIGVLTIVTLVLVGWQLIRSVGNGSVFTSIFQGGVRFNTYIALAVAQAYYGADGLAAAALVSGFMIVIINLLCISVFSLWGNNPGRGITPFLRDVIGNPLIVACFIGLFLSLSGIGVSGIAENTLEIVGRAALPLGLLAVGAALNPAAVHGHVGPIVISCIVQFGIKPLAAALLISITELSGTFAGVVVICFMVPTASSAYILARQLGGDTAAMASIISFQTLLAFLAMPLISLMML